VGQQQPALIDLDGVSGRASATLRGPAENAAESSAGIVGDSRAATGELRHHALKAWIAAQRIQISVVVEPVATASAEFTSALEQVDRALGFPARLK
jgi:hypothetical protein